MLIHAKSTCITINFSIARNLLRITSHEAHVLNKRMFSNLFQNKCPTFIHSAYILMYIFSKIHHVSYAMECWRRTSLKDFLESNGLYTSFLFHSF